MKFTKKLLNDIPVEKRDTILSKIKGFEVTLLQSKSFADIPKGFWIRKIAGTDIYKFRVNSGDRILFKYDKIDDEDSILFIAYSNHDGQIRTAKNYKGSYSIIDYEIDKQDYKEDEFDEDLNEYIKNEVYTKFAEVKKELVIEDEYISLSIEENDNENMYFLSLEQYECLSRINKPSIIFGCAGSGKTMVAIRKLIINNDLMVKTAYITCSNAVVNKTKMMYSKFTDNSDYVSFFTFKHLCKEIIGIEEKTVINYQDFYEWISQNEFFEKEDCKINIREIWIEINTLIKGSISKKENILSKEEYFNYNNSYFNVKTKKIIYKIAIMYNHWLMSNNYYDDNDLATIALEKLKSDYGFDYIIYDEIQELTSRQLLLIFSITNNVNNVMLLGDINQSINIAKFDLEFMKNLFYRNNSILDENFIIKNYRNGSETINWINEFKRIKNNKFKSIGKIFEKEEQSVKEGIKPRVFYDFKKEEEFFNIIDKDAGSIVIVVDESDRIELKEKGYEIGRIFSIEDVRGLEYNNVYCYNILSKFDNAWESILSNKYKCDDIYSVYFNMVYISATRAKNRLCFMEKGVTKLDNVLKSYWNVINDENIILDEVGRTSNVDQWLKEAIKLEKMEKYYQAAEAYKKAGRLKDADICLKAHERKINYSNTEKFASFILIEAEELNKQLLENALIEVKSKYDVSISGYIEINVDYEAIAGRRTVNKYIGDSLNLEEIADVIYQVLNEEYILKGNVILKACFYKEGVPIDTENMLKESFIDLLITFKNGKVEVCKAYHEKLRLTNKIFIAEKSECKNKTGFDAANQASILRNDAKYESKTPDDILDFIFNGNNEH